MRTAKRVAELAYDRWMNDDSHNWRISGIEHEIWISSTRKYNALKSNYQRWRVNKTGHRRDK